MSTAPIPTSSDEQEIPSWGPFDPPKFANLPPSIRPGSPTTIKIRQGPWSDLTAAARRRGVRKGKKPEMARRNTISGERQTKSFLPTMPFLRRAKTGFVGSDEDSQANANGATNTDDCPLLLGTDQGSGRNDSRPPSSGSEKTEPRFSFFRRIRKNSCPEARPRVNRRSRVQRTKTADDGHDSKDASGISFDDRLRLVRTLNSLLTRSSSNDTTPSGSDSETSSPLDPSLRTSLFCPSPTAQIPKEPEPQWLPMGSKTVAWTSLPLASSWLEFLERHLDSSQSVLRSFPQDTQNAILELKQQRAWREPGRKVCFVERPRDVFDLRTWDGIEPIDNGTFDGWAGAEVDEAAARPGVLRKRMDSARASISNSLQKLMGRKNSSSVSE